MKALKHNGFVYVLTNDAFAPDLLKIGFTRRTPDVRAKELYEKISGVPGKFQVKHSVQISNCIAAEEIVHRRLDRYRYNRNREFFKLPLSLAISEINAVAVQVNVLYGPQEPTEEVGNCTRRTVKSTQQVTVNCERCSTRFSVVLSRYESVCGCPKCQKMNKVSIAW